MDADTARKVWALKKILLTGGLGLSGGILGRTLLGMTNYNTLPAKPHPMSSIPGEISIPMPRHEDERKVASLADAAKSLAKQLPLQKDAQEGMLDQLLAKLAPYLPKATATSPELSWWAMPAMAATGLGGAHLGWKGTSALLDKRRESEQESRLEAARREYEEALRGHSKAGAALDTLAATWDTETQPGHEKAALWNETAGTLLTLALLPLAAGGVAGYKWTKSHSRKKMLEKALKQRALLRAAPQPLVAVPQPSEESETED